MLFIINVLVLIFSFAGQDEDLNYFISFPQIQQPDTTQINIWVEESLQDVYSGEFNEARKKVSDIRKWSQDNDYQQGIEMAEIRLADIFLYEHKYDSAEIILTNLLDIYPNAINKADIYNFLATSYRYKNEFEKAINMYKQLIEIAVEKDDGRTIAAAHQNMGVAYLGLGKNAEGLNSFMLSIEYAEAAKDTNFLVIALNNLGDSYNELGEYEEAEFYLKKSIRLARVKEMIPDLTKAITNLANVKTNVGAFEESKKLYDEALILSKRFRPNTPPVILLFNMGNLSFKMEDYDQAEKYFKESLLYSEELNIYEGIYHNKAGLGNIEEQRGNIRKAISLHEEVYEVARMLNINPFIMESQQKLYMLNRSAGNYEDALDYIERYKTLSDSLLDLRKEKEFADIKNEFEIRRQTEINQLLSEKQEQQEFILKVQYGLIILAVLIIILVLYLFISTRKVNVEKTKAYDQLAVQREELNKLFAIIAHDLRAPMATMQGILYLLKSGNLPKDQIDAFTDEVEDSIQKNIGVMEDLLSWAKEQMSGITIVKEEVRVYELIDSVISNQGYRSQLKQVSIYNEVDMNLQIKSDENALKLIMRNLLSNSIKFTNSGDTITFTSTVEGNKVKLCVNDTGIGMSQDLQEKVFASTNISFSVKGTKGEKGTGFGLSLIKEFVRKLGGSISIESKEGKGTKFCIELLRD